MKRTEARCTCWSPRALWRNRWQLGCPVGTQVLAPPTLGNSFYHEDTGADNCMPFWGFLPSLFALALPTSVSTSVWMTQAKQLNRQGYNPICQQVSYIRTPGPQLPQGCGLIHRGPGTSSAHSEIALVPGPPMSWPHPTADQRQLWDTLGPSASHPKI